MKALSITLKDLQILLKDRGAAFLLLILPLLFILVFSGALTAIGEASAKDERIPLAVVNLDGGASAQTLLEGIDAAGGVRVELYAEADAHARLKDHKLERVLTIPANFTADLAAARTTTLRLVSHPDARLQETEAVRLVIDGVARDMALESQIIASLRQMGDMTAAGPPELQVFTPERIIEQARSQFESAAARPLVTVKQSVPGTTEDRQAFDPRSVTTVPGFAVLFVFLTAQSTARSIFDEKKLGSFRRLMAAPISKAALLAGKLLPTFVTGLVQMAVIFAFGIFGLQAIGLPAMPTGNDPLGVAVVAVLAALCASAFGIVLAAIARTENQIGGVATVILWIAGMIGGAIVPLVFLEGFLGPLPQIVPHYWAIRAFDNLILRGATLASVGTELAVLAGFTVLFFVVGLWRFDFD